MMLLAVALLVGTAVAFAWTERLKLERAPIAPQGFDNHVAPGCGCPQETAGLRLLLRSSERLDIVVVNDQGEAVRTLAEDLERRPGLIELEWDGRDEAGRIVPDGPYRLRIRLERARRTLLTPTHVQVDTTPPEVGIVEAPDTTLSGESGIVLRYRSSERGTPILLVDGEVAERGRRVKNSGTSTLRWDSRLGATAIPAGLHEVAVAVEDVAGNRSEPTESVTILVVEPAVAR